MHRLLLVALAVWFTSCSQHRDRSVVVVSLNTTEQALLGEIVAQQVENRLKIGVDRMPGTTDARMTHETMMSGQADVMPQYFSDALTRILNLPPSRDQAVVRERLRLEYERRFQCEWTEPLGLHHGFVMVLDATRPEYANVRTLSETTPIRPGWSMGASSDFMMRPDGMSAMMKTYDLRWRSTPRALDAAQRYDGLKSRQLDIVSADLTDSQLLVPGWRKVEDDKNVFIAYETAIVARTESLNRFPGLREALKELSGKFNDDQVRAMNARIDHGHEPVREVARQFLKSAGLN
ncbi:MAG: hypothetical protein NTY38_03795 [Acidobacteria bacterium]|nr:hypothetical protein [Acidobacteriota bacterium]